MRSTVLVLSLFLGACAGPTASVETDVPDPTPPTSASAPAVPPSPDTPRAECLAGDCLSGIGTLRVVSREMLVTYEGPFDDGLPHGSGVARSTEGDILTGSFNHGLADGRVTITWADGATTPALAVAQGQLGLLTGLTLDHPERGSQRLSVGDREFGTRADRVRRLANLVGPRIEAALDTGDDALLAMLVQHLDPNTLFEGALLTRLMTDTDALQTYLDAGADPTVSRLLSHVALAAVSDGDEVSDALRLLAEATEPGAPGLADRLRIVLDRAANACRPTLTRLLLDIGGDPNGCLEHGGSCVSSTGNTSGTRPYTRALNRLYTLTEGTPDHAACDATVEILQPITPFR